MSDRIDVRKTYKLYVGGAVPAVGERPLLRGDRPQGPLPRQRRDGVAQGRPRRRRGRPQGVPRLVGGDGVQPGTGALPRRRAARGPPQPVRRRGRRRRGPHHPQGRGRGGRGDRPLGLVRRVVGQDRPGARLDQPGRRAVLRLLGARAHRRGRRPRPAGLVAARPGLRARTGRRHRQRRGGPRQRGAPAARGDALRGAGDLRRARRRRQRPHRPHRRGRAVARVAHGRQRDRPGRRTG